MPDANINTHDALWFLQGDDGTVYGPVDTATLKAWCLEGRIEPDNALSQDQETWIDAADVAELEMDWIARLEDGTRCGPFNLQLVPGLVENGIIPANALLENRHTGKRRTASGRAIADDLFPDFDDRLPDAGAQTQEIPIAVDAELTDDGWPEAEPTGGEDALAADDPLAEDRDDELPLSRRLEPLQRSATEARQQLVETRHALQTLRTAHTVLQDETQRLQDELASARKARQKGEQQLLELQDRAAAAETEVENLKAQLVQMKDHYDRLQLENQHQFEKLDAMQAERLDKEQRFKRELNELRDSADARTELLAGSVQLLMRDSDLAQRFKTAPIAAAAAAAENQVEQLKAAVRQLEQQLEHERRQAPPPSRAATVAPRRRPVAAMLLFLAGALVSAAVVFLVLKGCTRTPRIAAGTRRAPAVVDAGTTVASDDGELSLDSAGSLDLQPEASPLREAPIASPARATPPATQWPPLSLPSASIQQRDRTLRIVFSEGLFSVSTRLTPEASAALASLAEQLRGQLNGHQLMIEGHTDATPIAAAGSRYVDNFALGMARAEAVKTFLIETGKLPASAMRTSSAGESAPPFPNESEADRKRNRTAVLTLVAR